MHIAIRQIKNRQIKLDKYNTNKKITDGEARFLERDFIDKQGEKARITHVVMD